MDGPTKRAAGGRPLNHFIRDFCDKCSDEALAEQVAWMRFRASVLDFDAVFVSSEPLIAELFDSAGRCIGRWRR